MRHRLTTAVLLSLLLVPATARAQLLVNVGKLSDTVVDASSVNAGRPLDNGFYGVLNLFDAGENVINGINYTYWLSNAATRHWIKLRFGAPVEIRSVLVEFGAAEPPGRGQKSRRPEGYALDIKRLAYGEEVEQKLPSVNVGGFRVAYPLDAPLVDVVELTVVFPGHSPIEVHEIEAMGIPSAISGAEGGGPRIRDE